MVQKQAALSGGYRADQFADDDPLAELARIVGFEQPRAGHRPTADAQPTAPAQAFNLEDELLREFETFDAPAAKPEPAPVAQRVVAPPAPVIPVQQPAAVSAPVRREPIAVAAPVVAAPVLNEPFDWADELAQAEFVEAAAPVAARSVPQPVFEEPVFDEPAFDEVMFEEPAFEQPDFVVPQARQAAPEPHFESTSDFARDLAEDNAVDLADELERAFGASELGAPEPSWSATPPAPSRISLPLANFQAKPAARQEPAFEPSFGSSAPAAPVVAAPQAVAAASDFTTGHERREPMAQDAWPVFDDASRDNVHVEAAVEPLDVDLLDDFGDFDLAAEIPSSAPAPSWVEEPDFGFSFADELVATEQFAPIISEPIVRQAESAPVFERAPVVTAAPVAKPAPAPSIGADLLGDGEFELMLDDLDLDLSELDFSDAKPSAPVRAPVAAAVAPVAVPATRPQAVAYVPPVDTRLPFDPDDIVEQEEQPESLAILDVPDIAYSEPKEPVARRAEFDYDLDTELAGLFETPAATAAAVSTPRGAAAVTFAPPQGAKTGPLDDFDAFERALEEDFRRTLQTPVEPKARPAGRISLDQMPVAHRRSRLPAVWVLAASVAFASAAVAGGAYFWFSGSASEIAASGEPRVIMADKDPVKVVPDDKGGKSVPNQDKAVYDRVQGAAVTDPKQSSLISTSEEPVDVVQRTLLPDNLPLEGESEGEADGMATPVGDTSDPRLLPSGPVTTDASGAAEGDSAIAPRKVRTMIVKPDGTLVAQEVPASAPMGTMPAASAPALAAPSTPAAKPAPAAANPAPTQGRVETAAAPAQPAPAPAQAAPQVAEQTPPPAAATNAPVPSARPAEQPVNVVGRVTDQGNVTTTPRTQQQAAAAPAAPAASAPANASVPAGSYVIQIASLPSQADAQASYRNLSSKFANVIGGRGVDIKAAEIAGKGTYYRVRIPAGSKDEANALCARYKSAGGTCLVAR